MRLHFFNNPFLRKNADKNAEPISGSNGLKFYQKFKTQFFWGNAEGFMGAFRVFQRKGVAEWIYFDLEQLEIHNARPLFA